MDDYVDDFASSEEEDLFPSINRPKKVEESKKENISVNKPKQDDDFDMDLFADNKPAKDKPAGGFSLGGGWTANVKPWVSKEDPFALPKASKPWEVTPPKSDSDNYSDDGFNSGWASKPTIDTSKQATQKSSPQTK